MSIFSDLFDILNYLKSKFTFKVKANVLETSSKQQGK